MGIIPNDGAGVKPPGPNLTPRHLADLRESGLSDEQIAKCGLRSLTDSRTIRNVLRWTSYDGSLGDCLVIPFFDREGKFTGYSRLKPDRPRRQDAGGKPVKYESPKGLPNRAYFPPGTRTALSDPSIPLIITEGEKKAAKADQEGFPCIGLVGVYGWQKKRARDSYGKSIGPRELIDDLASIAWRGRLVHLCFDSDSTTNPNIPHALRGLTAVLGGLGATVKTTDLPGKSGLDGTPIKVGLDDFLVAHGREAFARLLGLASNAASKKGPMPHEAIDDPHRLARLYVGESCTHPEGLTLRFWRNQWCRWDGTAYRELPEEELRAELTASARREMVRINQEVQKSADAHRQLPTVRKITKGMISNVEQALESMTLWPGSIVPPVWLEGRNWRRRNLIAVQNGLLDVDELLAGRHGVLAPHSPRWFAENCLPYPFNIEVDCPRWLAFLNRNLEGDSERIGLLQEFFGYCLFPDTSLQKFLLLEGEGANGKSVVCAVLEAMLGRENCSHVPLESFGDRFQLAPTLGKLANIASEVGDLDKVAEGYLKSFTSGDTMQFDRKHKPLIQAVPTARLVLATNNRPRFSDRSGGLWRRMLLVPFRVIIAEGDPNRVYGMDKPTWWEASGELSGILNWALVGLDRLRRQGRFTKSRICEDALAEYRTENNPARIFLTEHYRAFADGRTPCHEIYQAYQQWCRENGYSPLADRAFGKEVRRVFTGVERRQVGGRENRVHAYFGIAADGQSELA